MGWAWNKRRAGEEGGGKAFISILRLSLPNKDDPQPFFGLVPSRYWAKGVWASCLAMQIEGGYLNDYSKVVNLYLLVFIRFAIICSIIRFTIVCSLIRSAILSSIRIRLISIFYLNYL